MGLVGESRIPGKIEFMPSISQAMVAKDQAGSSEGGGRDLDVGSLLKRVSVGSGGLDMGHEQKVI